MRISQLSTSSVLARSLLAAGLLCFAAATACSGDVENAGGNDGLAGAAGSGGKSTSGGTGGKGNQPGKPGFAGSGAGGEGSSACVDVCDDNATCQDVDGSFECVCKDGYSGDGTECEDIDECAAETDNCAGSCTNTDGGFECECPDGLAGDGVTCCEANGDNLALASTGVVATAKSTYPGYSVLTVNDGSASTEQTESESWSNDWPDQTFPQWVELTFPEARTFGRLELFTSDGYPVADYDLEYWDGAEWVSLAVVTDNSRVHRTHEFRPVTAEKVRVLTRKGYTQPTYHRINELQLFCQ